MQLSARCQCSRKRSDWTNTRQSSDSRSCFQAFGSLLDQDLSGTSTEEWHTAQSKHRPLSSARKLRHAARRNTLVLNTLLGRDKPNAQVLPKDARATAGHSRRQQTDVHRGSHTSFPLWAKLTAHASSALCSPVVPASHACLKGSLQTPTTTSLQAIPYHHQQLRTDGKGWDRDVVTLEGASGHNELGLCSTDISRPAWKRCVCWPDDGLPVFPISPFQFAPNFPPMRSCSLILASSP